MRHVGTTGKSPKTCSARRAKIFRFRSHANQSHKSARLTRSRGARERHERAVGCGGVAFLGDFAELKRMYCRPAMRGQGVAPALLAKIEEAARDAGFTRLRLETGVHQHAAIRFYERSGFRVRGPFGAYAAMAPQAIALSAFFEKTVPQVDAPLTPLLRDLL